MHVASVSYINMNISCTDYLQYLIGIRLVDSVQVTIDNSADIRLWRRCGFMKKTRAVVDEN